MMRYLLDHDNLKYQLETLAQHEPDDLDSTEFDVAYENESGAEVMATVCCIDLAARSLSRIKELEAALSQQDAVAYAVFTENGNIRIWCADPIQAETLGIKFGDELVPLYTAPPSTAQGVGHLMELIGEYFEIGVAEGAEGRDHDTEDHAAQRKLEQIESAQAGMVMFPVEPTGAMIRAAQEYTRYSGRRVRNVYITMLVAASKGE